MITGVARYVKNNILVSLISDEGDMGKGKTMFKSGQKLCVAEGR